jgi:hypothetical protein
MLSLERRSTTVLSEIRKNLNALAAVSLQRTVFDLLALSQHATKLFLVIPPLGGGRSFPHRNLRFNSTLSYLLFNLLSFQPEGKDELKII